MVVASTRPEVIKLAPVLRALESSGTEHTFVTTGQHYDDELFWRFIRELGLREPEHNIDVRSGSHAYQTARALEALERLILQEQPQVVIAEGDTNSVLSTALACAKLLVPFAHVEAGLRSFDRTMPEEVNRVLADHVSTVLFAPTERAADNLVNEGILPESIFVVGNTIVDATLQHIEIARKKLKPRGGEYLLLTLHRAENVDRRDRLEGILRALAEVEQEILFPVHPRTLQRLKEFNLLELAEATLTLLPPVGYLEFLLMLEGAKVVLTDSGGVQEEAIVLGTPCITLRTSTERPETVEAGGNILAGVDRRSIAETVRRVLQDAELYERMRRAENPFGDGRSGERIVSILLELAEKGALKIEPPSRVIRTRQRRLLRAEKLQGKRISELGMRVCRVVSDGCFRYPAPEHRLSRDEMLEVEEEVSW
ncbi:MAG: UDP-N-acetylglucosamine 2-epimerase (non-hydrolyzing) [Euryarchaeota archaeon]|nr:UDP-N-acetylglucosamine 2-epimerase (non-hydrolyzing) [Euryarchaeota archaeon]